MASQPHHPDPHGRDLPFTIHVTEHVRERARFRFPDFKLARIIDEVRLAFRAGRFSGRPPAGFATDKEEGFGFYAWTPDGERIYALRTNDQVVAVVTVVRAFEKCDPSLDRRGLMRCPHGCVIECARSKR